MHFPKDIGNCSKAQVAARKEASAAGMQRFSATRDWRAVAWIPSSRMQQGRVPGPRKSAWKGASAAALENIPIRTCMDVYRVTLHQEPADV